MSVFTLTYKPFGDKAILVEWPHEITEEILYDILDYKRKIQEHYKNFRDIVTTYNSLTVHLDESIDLFDNQIDVLKKIYNLKIKKTNSKNYIWHIPICYDITLAPDLNALLKYKNISLDRLITLHTEPLYTIYFLGFLPGFPYLGGLQESLFMPRKTTPELNVVKGSVGIGGKQTGIYTVDSPGGWHIIGKTPITLFDVSKALPSFLKAGDKIKFYAISKIEYEAISKEMHKNSFIIKKEQFNV